MWCAMMVRTPIARAGTADDLAARLSRSQCYSGRYSVALSRMHLRPAHRGCLALRQCRACQIQ